MNKKHRIVYRMDYALILQEKGGGNTKSAKARV
jgi:hypothetical protein